MTTVWLVSWSVYSSWNFGTAGMGIPASTSLVRVKPSIPYKSFIIATIPAVRTTITALRATRDEKTWLFYSIWKYSDDDLKPHRKQKNYVYEE